MSTYIYEKDEIKKIINYYVSSISVLSEDCEIIHSGVTLNCLGLSKFPNGSAYRGVETLNFHNNNFTELTPSIFKNHNFHNLKIVIIRQNGISHIHPYAFTDMWSVRELDLYGNNLIYLHDSVFDGLKELKYLDLGHNKLKLVEGATFKPLRNLETLDLSYNSIKVLTPYLLVHTNVTELYLSGNEIELTHDSSILESDSLTVLTLQSCKLKTLHKNAFVSLPNLKYLDISYNQLELIPEGLLEPLKHLEQLDVSNNGISVLNVNLFPLPSKLEVLLCDQNLSDLSIKCEDIVQQLQADEVHPQKSDSRAKDNFIQSTQVESQLSKDGVSHLEQCVGKLLVLSLYDNPIKSIPASSVKLLPLLELDHNYNQISSLNNMSMPSLPSKVTKLILDNDQVELDEEWKIVFQKFEIHVRPKTTYKNSVNNTLSRHGTKEPLKEDENEWLEGTITELPDEDILVVLYFIGVSGLVTLSTRKYQFLQA